MSRSAKAIDGMRRFIQFGDIAVPNQSDHIYLVATRPGPDRPVAASIAFSADQDDPESNPTPGQVQPKSNLGGGFA
jgi:hypothetical protein